MYALQWRSELPGRVAQELESMIAAIKRWGLAEHNEDGTHIVGDRQLDIVPVGALFDFAGATAPAGYLLCDGSQVSRIDYKALFNIIGTTYGAGNGTTTFNLPDYRGKFALTKAASGTGANLGDSGGNLDHTHGIASHSHSVTGTTNANGGFSANTTAAGGHDHGGITGASDSNAGIATTAGGTFFALNNHKHTIASVSDHNHGVSVGDHSHTVSGSTDSTSSGATDAANPPYLVANKIIFAGVAFNA